MKPVVFVAKDAKGGIESFIKQITLLSNGNNDKFSLLSFKKNRVKIQNKTILTNRLIESPFFLIRIISFIVQLIKLSQAIKKNNRFFLKKTIYITLDLYSLIVISLFIKLWRKKNFKHISLINTNYLKAINEKRNRIYIFALRLAVRYCLQLPNKIIFVSKELKKNIIKEFGIEDSHTRCVCIYNGVSEWKEIYKPNIDKKLSVMSVGRMENQKDFYTIIDSLYILDKYYKKKIQLKLVGEGYNEASIKSYAHQKHVDCSMKKWALNPRNLFDKNDIFIFSSQFEGFGRVIIEAMSVGLPVIATDTPFGPSEILGKGKYGILVPMKDPEAMAQAILKLIKSKELREKYSRLSLQRARFFSEKKMLKKYERLFLQLSHS